MLLSHSRNRAHEKVKGSDDAEETTAGRLCGVDWDIHATGYQGRMSLVPQGRR